MAAKEAVAKEEAARREVEKLLAAEKAHVQQLQSQRKKIATDLK